jgi:hypothetical protein
MMGFTDKHYLDQLIEQLHHRGVVFAPGLTEDELGNIEADNQFRFPIDLRAFLAHAMPVYWHRTNQVGTPMVEVFPNWRGGTMTLLNDCRDYLIADYPEAEIDSAPRLLPLYSHRFMPAEPTDPGNPIFSVVGKDVIHYGNDLADYFVNEFGIERPRWAANAPRPIRFWGDLVS